MTTTTLSSNKPGQFLPLYQMVLRRNLGYFGLISALIILFYPVQYAREIFKTFPVGYQFEPARDLMSQYSLYAGGRNMTDISVFFFSALLILLPFVLALMLGGYMHSKKATDVFHSLPVRRETLLLVNAAVAMTILAVPVILSDIAIAIMSTAKFGWRPELVGEQFLSMAGWLICAFATYAITTLVTVFCGTVFDSFLYSGIVLHAVPIIGGIFMMICSVFLYGYSPNEEHLLNLGLQAPTIAMIFRLVATIDGLDSMGSEALRYYSSSNTAILVYLIVGIVVIAIAARIYRSRKSELAEMTGLSGPVQLVIKLVGTLACAVPTGLMFYAIGGLEKKGVYLFWLVIGAVVSYVILDVIVHRGFKNLGKRLIPAGATVGIIVASSLIIMYGGGGYENRVPSVDNVQSIRIEGYGGYMASNVIQVVESVDKNDHLMRSAENAKVILSDPTNIQTVTSFHKNLVTRDFERTMRSTGDYNNSIYCRITLEYQLKNGSRMTRYYKYMDQETLGMLIPLESNPEFTQQADGLYVTRAEDTVWSSYNGLGGSYRTLPITQQQTEQLQEAIRADLGARTQQSLEQPSGAPLAILESNTNWTARARREAKIDDRFAGQCVFFVNETDVHTAKFLRDNNLMPETPDLSKCTGVFVEPANRRHYSRSYGSGSQGLIVQVTPNDGSFEYSGLAQEEMWLKQEQEQNKDENGYFPSNAIFKDAAQVSELAQGVRSTCRGDKGYLIARFYFSDGYSGVRVMIPYENISPAMKALIPIGEMEGESAIVAEATTEVAVF